MCSPSSWVNAIRREMEMQLFARDFLFPCGEDTLCCWIDDWVTVRDWQTPLRRDRRLFVEGCAGHGEKKVKRHWEQKSSGGDDGDEGKAWPNVLSQPRPGVSAAEQRRRRPGSNSAGSQKKHILLFAPRACGAGPALFTRTGRWPLTYYLVLASLSLSQRELHQRGLSEGLFYLHTGCAVLPLCLTTFRGMSGVLWISTEIYGKQHKNFVFKALRLFFRFNLSTQSAYCCCCCCIFQQKTDNATLEHWNYKKN